MIPKSYTGEMLMGKKVRIDREYVIGQGLALRRGA